MSSKYKLSRRRFLKASGVVGTSVLAGASGAPAFTNQAQRNDRSVPVRHPFFDLVRPPDVVTTYETMTPTVLAKSNGSAWAANGITVRTDVVATSVGATQLKVALSAPGQPVSRIHLRW